MPSAWDFTAGVLGRRSRRCKNIRLCSHHGPRFPVPFPHGTTELAAEIGSSFARGTPRLLPEDHPKRWTERFPDLEASPCSRRDRIFRKMMHLWVQIIIRLSQPMISACQCGQQALFRAANYTTLYSHGVVLFRKRSSLRAEISRVCALPSVISSARSIPTAGAC